MLPEDMKRWRATRRRWRLILLLALVTAILCIVGPMDYADQVSTAADVEIVRAHRMATRGCC